jgi:DNA helicase-2/ATP-dependent DNA helicase PcrA
MLILCIRLLIGKIRPEADILHVLIDEAQDCNAPQLWFLKNYYPRSFFTILADVNQSVGAEAGIGDYGLFERIFGDGLKSVRLYKSYRSSGPINALAFRLLGLEGSDWEYFDRKGEKPRYVQTGSIEAAVSGILDDEADEGRSVGIITPTIDEAEKLYAALRGKREVRLLADPGKKLGGKIVVLPLLLAKGLEFDAVVAVNLMRDGGAAAACRRTAYLAGSRALHMLYYVNDAPLPELYRDCEELLNFQYFLS